MLISLQGHINSVNRLLRAKICHIIIENCQGWLQNSLNFVTKFPKFNEFCVVKVLSLIFDHEWILLSLIFDHESPKYTLIFDHEVLGFTLIFDHEKENSYEKIYYTITY